MQIAIACCMGVEFATLIIWRIYLQYCNRKKTRAIAEMGLSEEEITKKGQALGAEDATDMGNPFFL